VRAILISENTTRLWISEQWNREMNPPQSEPRGYIRDVGTIGTQLRRMALEGEKTAYLSTHTLISTRAVASTRFIYRHLLPRIQSNKMAIVVLPLARTWSPGEATVEVFQSDIDLQIGYRALVHTLSEEERCYLRSWREIEGRPDHRFDIATLFATRRNSKPLVEEIEESLNAKISLIAFGIRCAQAQPGMIIQNELLETEDTLGSLAQIQEVLTKRQHSSTAPVVVLVDIPTRLDDHQERKLLRFLRNAGQLKTVVWLHTPLIGLSEPLLTHFGNFIVFHASRADIAIIEKVLPVPRDLDFRELPSKALIYTPSLGLDRYRLFDLEIETDEVLNA
jgi:hypothetical protein